MAIITIKIKMANMFLTFRVGSLRVIAKFSSQVGYFIGN